MRIMYLSDCDDDEELQIGMQNVREVQGKLVGKVRK
ncbi:hypothetical protein Goari_017936 [Gossypium aridum]|uniref:Uncharacterized protein n=1 Tax=Gossypium aridum TaxID=34290 RepID=A0A7J8WNM0_GOSAI|nr:hypothetical protein [Gossypium aridum]